MSDFKEVTPSEFGAMILTWSNQGVNPLEVISFEKHFDDYLPTIRKYQPDAMEETTLIVGGSYPTRQTALSKVGEWWDKALSE